MAGYRINGPLIAGDVSNLSTIRGNTIVGGSTNTTTLSNSAVAIGGSLSTSVLSGIGCVDIAGSSTTATILGDGGVCVSASALVGTSSADTNLVVIGGSNTTIAGSGSVAAGPSALTKLYQPANPKMFVMGSPVITKTGTSFSSPPLTAAALSGGSIEFTTAPGAYTMPSSSDLCIELLDTSLTSFTGTPRHTFCVNFYNNSGGVCTIATGAGQTLTNTTSPVSLANGESRTWVFTFLTPTSMLVEDSSPLTMVSLTNAGTTSLVNNGVSPNLATKGLINGTAIGFTTTATDVTITNTGVTSITGTTDQVIASAATGPVTLSLPQNIAPTSTPTFAEVTITGTVTNPTDAATKQYVDTVAMGLNVHAAVEAATTVNLNAFYTNGTPDTSGGLGIGATLTSNVNQDINTAAIIDGYTGFIVTARVLVKNQASQIANGIYTITDLGSGGTPWILTRATDYDDSTLYQVGAGDLVFVAEGLTQASTFWVQTNVGTGVSPDHIIIGTDNIVFSQFGGPGTYTAGNGLTLTANQFSLISPVTPANGGTGTITPPIAGQIPIGTAGNVYTPASLTAGTAIGIVSASGSITINNTGVTSISGTPSEIVATPSTGSVTLGLPPAVVISSTLTVSGLTQNAFIYSGFAGLISSTAAATDGQLLIGSTLAAPVAATLSAGPGITITNGPGTIQIAGSGVTSVTGTAFQVTASPTTGAVVVGLPPAVVISSTLTVSGLTPNAFIYSGFGGLISSTATAGDGQILIGSTGGAPVLSSISAGNGMVVTNGSGTIAVSVLEPFYTSNSRAIISGTGNTLTGVSSTSGGGIFGGNAINPTISAASGSVTVGGASTTSTPTLGGTGNVCVGSNGANGFALTGSGNVVVGSSSLAATLNGTGCVVVGSSSIASSAIIAGTGNVVVGSNAAFTGVTGFNASSSGNVVIASSAFTGSFGASAIGCSVVGGTSSSTTLNGTGSVSAGGYLNVGSLSGNGSSRLGGNANTTTISGDGATMCGGIGNAGTMTGNGVASIGGNANTLALTTNGGTNIGGSSKTITIDGSGCVAIAAGGEVGTGITQNCVLIGGSGTTFSTSAVLDGSVCIGSSTAVQTFAPSQPSTFIKANPFFGMIRTVYTSINISPTAAEMIGGYLVCNPSVPVSDGTLTFPSAGSIYSAYVCAVAGFNLNMSFTFAIANRKSAGSTLTLAPGTGISIFGSNVMFGTAGTNSAKIMMMIFTSPTTAEVITNF